MRLIHYVLVSDLLNTSLPQAASQGGISHPYLGGAGCFAHAPNGVWRSLSLSHGAAIIATNTFIQT